MQILITGFENSGVHTLRRILSVHPHIEGSFAEKHLMTKFKTIEDGEKLINRHFSIVNDNWIEAVNFYDHIKNMNPIDYIRTWNKCFGKTAKVIHIVRHPVDVSLTKLKQIGEGDLRNHLEIYKEKMRVIVPKISNMKNSITIKYEDLLLRPDETLPKIFEFCEIDAQVDFRAALLTKDQPKFINSLNSSKVFLHEYSDLKVHMDMSSTYEVINKCVGGVIYK